MPTITAETTEQIVSHALDDLRAQFQRALSAEGESGTTFFALGTKLYVDQSRRIVVNAGWPDLWTVRDGKRCISTATALDQATLAMFVGADRFLTAAALFMILADIVAGKRQRAPETAIATFVNLAAVEPYFYPQRDLAIWLTVARFLDIGREQKDLHAVLPELSTDFDVFHQELPVDSRDAAKLRPTKPVAPPLAYEISLAAAVLPELAAELATGASQEERARALASHAAELRGYIREQLFGRLARAVAAAGGGYASLHSPERSD